MSYPVKMEHTPCPYESECRRIAAARDAAVLAVDAQRGDEIGTLLQGSADPGMDSFTAPNPAFCQGAACPRQFSAE